jgi:hypothetical protein
LSTQVLDDATESLGKVVEHGWAGKTEQKVWKALV